MAIYTTDREKRIKGDRIVDRKDGFKSVSPEVFGFYKLFCAIHALFTKALENRRREQTEDVEVRRVRDKVVSEGAQLYSWAWNFPALSMRQSWRDVVNKGALTALRERLFPLGKPNNIHSTQLVFDAIKHFNAAYARETEVNFDEDFLRDTKDSEEQIRAAIADVTRETDETTEAVVNHQEAREKWDIYFKSLKEVTSAYLRIQGRSDELKTLFRAPIQGKKDSGLVEENNSSEEDSTQPQS